ncbi:hypothetical protein [Kordiimonas sp.]|uniref:hypothetical protein n=1 Tax=Kordiimonas sp. TaxID=1970157 RepID=UPI003A92149E
MTNLLTEQPRADELVSGLRIALVVVGTAITLPAFLVGTEILTTLGVVSGGLAVLMGGVILALLACASMLVAVRSRLTTYQLLDHAFGLAASRIASFIVAATLLGWFGVTAALFGQSLSASLHEVLGVVVPEWACTVAGCLLMTVTTLYGFSALEKLSKIAVPVMFFILIYAVVKVVHDVSLTDILAAGPVEGARPLAFGAAVSIIVGSFMVGVCILPDISRFIRRPRQVLHASFGSFGSFFPLILIVAGLPGVLVGEKDLVMSMVSSGLGLPALVMMVLASWTTNVSNLYSSSLGLGQAFPRLGRAQVVWVAGLVGLLISLAGIRDHFVDFLIFLGVLIPPIAGVYIAHSFAGLPSRGSALSLLAIGAWLGGTCLALVTSMGYINLTFVPALDSFFAAVALYLIFTRGRASTPR